MPADSAFGRTAGSLQWLLLSPFESTEGVDKGAWKLQNLAVALSPADVAAKQGQHALQMRGDAEVPGAKGDFTVAGAVPGKCKLVGMWIHLTPNANVESVGFQLYDAEGEALLSRLPANWSGWKWVELDLQGGALTQAYEQADKNKKPDFPLKGVHVVWFARAAGPSSLDVDALVASTEMDNIPATPEIRVSGAVWGETNLPLATQQIVVTNYADTVRAITVDYTVQRDPALFAEVPPDPDAGSDQAVGAKSWTEEDGTVLETGSLTDGKDWTNASLPWGSHKEAVQYVDLGQERTIIRLAYLAGDANWAWKAEFSASTDGKTYTPVPGLQEVDMHGKWGYQQLPTVLPFSARYLRLRHHNGGQVVNQISLPATLAVYDGITDEKWEFPTVGETIAKGAISRSVEARAFGTLDIPGDKPLAPGAYLITARVREGARTQLIYRHFMVMPAPLKTVAHSRFGLNTSNYLLAPLNRRLGIGWVRFENFKWPMISPAPNEYRFDGTVTPWVVPHDKIVSAYRAQGLQILPFLFQTADYATSAPASAKNRGDSYPPRDNAQMADFVYQSVSRYGSKKHPITELKTSDKKSGLNQIHTYEIWNEPNLTDPGWGPWVGTAVQYNEMFRAAAEAVKRADPQSRVTNGGIAGIDVETMNTLLIPYADKKKPLDFVDILNVHFYSGRIAPESSTTDPNADRSGNVTGMRTYEQDLQRLVSWRDKNKPGMPIWMTETGYDSAGPFGTNEHTQAARLPRVIMLALAAGIEKVIVYRESGSTPSMHAASGVLRDDGTLKPSWFTYATMIRELDGVETGALRLPYPDPNVRLYAWTRGTETILSAWTMEGKGNLNLKLGKTTVTDAFGSVWQQNITDKLPISTFPLYLKNISNPSAVRALVDEARKAEIARKQERARLAKTRAYLFDFGSKDKVGTLDIGDTRSFTPVVSADTYSDPKGYGFFPTPAGADNVMNWVNDPLERDSTRMNPEHVFRLRVPPGRYELRLRIRPQAAGEVTIKGVVGGDKVLPVIKDGPVVTTQIEVGAMPLSLSNNAYGDIHWLTLVEQARLPNKN